MTTYLVQLTQRDLTVALAAPVFRDSFTLADIQKVVPGLTPNEGDTLPEWTDTVMIQ